MDFETSPKLGMSVYYEDAEGTIYPATITHLHYAREGAERAPCDVDLFVMGRAHNFHVWEIPAGAFGQSYKGKWFYV